jgi:hypothetical protein
LLDNASDLWGLTNTFLNSENHKSEEQPEVEALNLTLGGKRGVKQNLNYNGHGGKILFINSLQN